MQSKASLTSRVADDPVRASSRAGSLALDHQSRGEHFAAGVKACLPVVMGYLAVGIAFGVVARTAGLSVAEVALMSLILYAGSAQFIAAGMIGAAAGAPGIIATIFLVNVRHFLYSAALAPHLRRLPAWKNALIGAELTDETFSVMSNHLATGGVARAPWFFGLNVTAQATWFVATVSGALLGSAIPDTRALGLDFALAGMFAALLVIQMASRPNLRPALIVAVTGAVVAVGGAGLIGESWSIVAATVIAASVGLVLDGRKRAESGVVASSAEAGERQDSVTEAPSWK
jgi:4-azaleucine resistance transporter AzlC